jgi:hypothetical protein
VGTQKWKVKTHRAPLFAQFSSFICFPTVFTLEKSHDTTQHFGIPRHEAELISLSAHAKVLFMVSFLLVGCFFYSISVSS